MQTVNLVEDYMIKAVQRAQFEHLEDGSLTAWVPDFPGLIALGTNGEACLIDLWRRLNEWLQASFEEGLQLPVIGGIDLNTEDNRKRAAYHARGGEHENGRFFETDDDFFAALAQ